MPLFMFFYLVIAAIMIVAVFILSYKEKKNEKTKAALTAIFIIAIIGVVFCMGALEVRYGYSKLVSSIIAAAIIGLMYLADMLGGKLADKKRSNINGYRRSSKAYAS